MRSGVSIREADPRDANAIGDCLRAAFEPYRVAYTREAYDNTMFTTETMRERFASMSVLVAVTEIGEIVGTVSSQLTSRPEGHCAAWPCDQTTRALGVSPHRCIKLTRFEEVGRLVRGDRFERLADIAHELNYADQSHFIK
jgi:hypothetical protein